MFKEKIQDGTIAGIWKEQSKSYKKEGKQKGQLKVTQNRGKGYFIELFLRPALYIESFTKCGAKQELLLF